MHNTPCGIKVHTYIIWEQVDIEPYKIFLPHNTPKTNFPVPTNINMGSDLKTKKCIKTMLYQSADRRWTT